MNINDNIDEEKKGKKFFSQIGFRYIALTIFTVFCQIILMVIAMFIDENLINDLNSLMYLSAITSIITVPFFMLIMNKFKKYNIEKKKLGIVNFILCIIVAFSLTYIGNFIGIGITSLIGDFISSPISNPVDEMINNLDIWALFLTTVIIAPIVEELIYRKILIDRTIKYGAFASIIISATIFGFCHGNFNQFFYAFLLGAFFSFVYIKTGRIEYTMILHGIVNFFGSIFSLFLSSLVESVPANIDNLTDAEIMANIGDFSGMIIVGIVSLIFLAMIIAGIVLIILNYKKMKLPPGQITIKKSSLFLNWGMIIFIIFHLFVFALSIFG